MTTTTTTPAACLAALPDELLERILGFVEEVHDLVSLNATSSLFRGPPLEQALLEMGSVWRGAQRHALALGVCDETDHGGHLSMSAFVTASGELHTCGEHFGIHHSRQYPLGHYWGFENELLGHGGYEELVPRRVAALDGVRITAVAVAHGVSVRMGSSKGHVLALSDAGAVYAWGENNHALGLDLTRSQRPPCSYRVSTPTRISALRNEHIVCISASRDHNLALAATGRVHSWGIGADGRLGHGDEQNQLVPKLVEGLAHVRIAGISAGPDHSLALSTAGAVYSFGSGGNGQLGHGHTANQLAPVRIEALAGVRAVHVSAGYRCSVVVDDAGDAHSFGCGASGQLGHGDEMDRLAPTRIEALANARIVRARAGHAMDATVLLDDEGGTYVCGDGRYASSFEDWLVPARVEELRDTRVVDVSLNAERCAVVTSDGRALMWGQVSGALGDGRSMVAEDRLYPVSITSDEVKVPQLVRGKEGEPLQLRVPREQYI